MRMPAFRSLFGSLFHYSSPAWCRILALVTAVFLPVSLWSQGAESGSIQGRVLNAQTGRFLNRAVVRLEGTNQQTFTNQFGEFEFYNMSPGMYTLRVSYTGLADETAIVNLAPRGTVTQEFTLGARQAAATPGEEEFELAEFEVSARDSFRLASELAVHEERFSVNLKNVVSTDAFGITAQGNVGEFVKYIPGVTIEYGGTYSSGADANAIKIRGFSANETYVTMDGIPVANASPGTLNPAVGLDMLSINNASRVEVIKVPTPDQPNVGLGGTVNLISKTAFEYPRPSLNVRVYLAMNSENLDFFKKTPGPMNKPTYKTLPSVDLTYAVPVNDKFGFSLTLASANQANENHKLKAGVSRAISHGRPTFRRPGDQVQIGGTNSNYWMTEDPRFSTWQQEYGADWKQWTDEQLMEMYNVTDITRLDDIKRLPRYDQEGNLVGAWSVADQRRQEETMPMFVDADGNELGRAYYDWAHPYVNTVSVTDSPRISHRNSAALKLDWRPLDGLLVTTNYQYSTFEDADATRRAQMNPGGQSGIGVIGPDYIISREDRGSMHLNTDAFAREGVTHSGYLRFSYVKGPWNASGHISYSDSESDLLSIENGHFSVVELRLGNIHRTEFRDISAFAVPSDIRYYRALRDADGNKIGEELIDLTDLSNFGIANYNASDPNASTLTVNSGGINSISENMTWKADVRRDLDFIPGDFMNLAVKVGIDRQERTETKSGRGSNYRFQYIGASGVELNIEDFRDENYVGVEPGFGLQPFEWPDVYKFYSFYQANPQAFSDTLDVIPAGQTSATSIAAQNYIESVNTSKSIKEIRTSYYGQLEGNFLRNRLNIVGGIRVVQRERSGYGRGTDSNWRYLRYNEDAEGDGFLDVIRDHEGVDIDPYYKTSTLPRFSITDPYGYTDSLRQHRVSRFEDLPVESQELLRTFWRYYEQAGAVYGDGTPFNADTFMPLQEGTLRAAQLQYIKDYALSERAKNHPQPIISMAYDITDRLVARLSWSTSYQSTPFEARGDGGGAGALLRQVQFNENAQGTGGSIDLPNPDLRTAKSTQWNAGLSYHTDSGGKFSTNFYYSTTKDRAIGVTYRVGDERYDEVMAMLGYGPNSRYRSGQEQWEIKTDLNAEGTYLDYGYELEARQDFSIFGGWGKYIYAFAGFNHRFQKEGSVPEGQEGLFDVAGQDERMSASGGISLSIKRLNVRANFTWEDEYIRSISNGVFWRDPTLGNPGWYTPSIDDDEDDAFYQPIQLIRPAEFKVDLTITYRLTDRYTLDFSARNVTNEKVQNYYITDGEYKLPLYGAVDGSTEIESFGVYFTAGVSARF